MLACCCEAVVVSCGMDIVPTKIKGRWSAIEQFTFWVSERGMCDKNAPGVREFIEILQECNSTPGFALALVISCFAWHGQLVLQFKTTSSVGDVYREGD